VVVAYNDIGVLTEQLAYRNEHQQAIEKAREAYRNQFDIGQRTLLDLLDTENEYFQARRAYTNTNSDLSVAVARTFASEGELLEKLGIARSDITAPEKDDGNESYNVCQAVAPEMTGIGKASFASTAVATAAVKPTTTLTPLVKPVKPVESNNIACSTASINAALNGWAEAWRKKDINSYLGYYATTFKPENGLTKSAWESQRRKRLSQAGAIALTLNDVSITAEGDNASARFVQNYVSSGYKDTVNKTITFQPIGATCQIVREESMSK
jgi:outer membrane protein, adhesin transport system